MKRILSNVVLPVLLVLISLSVKAEVIAEATVGGGYQGNLFNDSNSTGDSYAAVGMDLKYYPSAFTQLAAGAQYSAFADHGDLSNVTGDLSITIIPTPEASPLSLTLAGAVAARKFGTLYELYDQVGSTAGADFSYRMARWVYLLTSVSCLNNSYTNSNYGSNRGIDFAAGANLTILGSNSLALRADYSRRSFDQPSPTQGGSDNNPAAGQEESETYEITGVSLRYSRPLGERTGLNLSLGHRRLHLDNDYAVLGYTIDYLSPWANLWEGMSFSCGLKHFFPKQITSEFSFAYYDKSFVDVIELGEGTSETYWRDTRADHLTALSLLLSRPFTLQSGKQLTPFVNLGYRKNRSSTGFFDYADFQASISLKIYL